MVEVRHRNVPYSSRAFYAFYLRRTGACAYAAYAGAAYAGAAYAGAAYAGAAYAGAAYAAATRGAANPLNRWATTCALWAVTTAGAGA